MTNALPYIFFAGMAFACLSAAVSLFTPRTAIFFRNKTRPKGFFAWLCIALVCFVCVGIFAPEEQREAARAKRAVADQAEAAAEKAWAGAKQTTSDSKAQKSEEDSRIFEYQVTKSIPTKTRHGRVDGGLIYIYPSEPDIQLTSQKIGTTCLSAAKFFINNYSKEYDGIDTMHVIITDAPYDIYKYHRVIYSGSIGKLATCHYYRTRRDGWEVISLEASARNTTPAEKQIEDLWFKLHGKYKRGNRIDDAALKKEIGLKLNIKPEDINFSPVPPEKLDPKQFKDIAPHGPVEAQD